jgi:hypothetical protein
MELCDVVLDIVKENNTILETLIMSDGHLKFAGYVKKQENILSNSTNTL